MVTERLEVSQWRFVGRKDVFRLPWIFSLFLFLGIACQSGGRSDLFKIQRKSPFTIKVRARNYCQPTPDHLNVKGCNRDRKDM